jgi:hypothetical protein
MGVLDRAPRIVSTKKQIVDVPLLVVVPILVEVVRQTPRSRELVVEVGHKMNCLKKKLVVEMVHRTLTKATRVTNLCKKAMLNQKI